MKVPTDPRVRGALAYRAGMGYLARKREEQAWRETEALIRRVSNTAFAFLKSRRRKR